MDNQQVIRKRCKPCMNLIQQQRFIEAGVYINQVEKRYRFIEYL